MSIQSFSRTSSSVAPETKRTSEMTENFISRANSPMTQKISKLSDHLVNLQKVRSETPSVFSHKEKPSRAKNQQFSDLIRKIGHLNSEKAELELRNKTLREENQELKTSLQRANAKIKKLRSSFKKQKPKETDKYLKFIALKINEAPQLKQIVSDRIGSFNEFGKVFNDRKEDSCVKLLQILSDLCVKELTFYTQDNATQTYEQIKVYGKPLETDSNRSLIQNIEKQSEKIASLNKQISDAMLNSKPLLEQLNIKNPNKYR